MFQQLTNYLLGAVTNQEAVAPAEGVETGSLRLTSVEAEDEWVLVDRDSEGNSEVSSGESLDGEAAAVEKPSKRSIKKKHHTRTSSATSVPGMEESWFLTPPPCFTSTGPVHMATSPLENLLIEHPSMSVYSYHRNGGRRATYLRPATPPPRHNVEEIDEEEEEVLVQQSRYVLHEVEPAPRINRQQVLQQQERQSLKGKQAQKVQIQKACKSMQRSHLDRTNKAREVNSRNRRQRRGERSQGAKRSFANNNRKCC